MIILQVCFLQLFCLSALSWAAPAVLAVEKETGDSNSLPETSTVRILEITGNSHQTAAAVDSSVKLFKLVPVEGFTAAAETLILNMTRNDFHHSLDTTCLPYTGYITSGGDDKVNHSHIGWTTVSLCNNTMIGLLSLSKEGLYTIQPAAAAGQDPSNNVHMLQKHHYPPHSTSQSHCSTTSTVPSTTKDDQQPTHTSKTSSDRLKRHQQSVIEKTIQLAVYVDRSLADLHQTNLSTYLLHIMNTVSHLYKDSSLGGSSIVHIAVVYWNSTDSKIGSPNSSPSQVRDAFCQWKSKQSPSVHHDIALLLTRDSICETSQCGVLGISEYRNVCVKGRNCIVVKDTGLSTAFTIAHELGHSCGMYHDGDKNIHCQTNGYYLMASSFQASSNPHKWSSCSQQQLYDFLSSPASSCLDNLPDTTITPPLRKAPLIGQDYSLNKQCQLLYGDSASSCHKTNCSMLWCSLSNGPCIKTQYSPPAGGSPCLLSNGSNGVCYHGNCLSHSNVTRPIDGGWGQWSEWGACSATCDNGVQAKYRECNSPLPQFGGRRCRGERIVYRYCKNLKCPPHKDYRNTRCLELAKTKYDVSASSHVEEQKWSAVDPHDLVKYRLNYCQLYCKLSGDSSIFLMDNKVPLGTSCATSDYSTGVCINSKCIQVGCDGTLGRRHFTDRCGVECGDNSSCHSVSFIFTPTEGRTKGYENVISVPSGATNIKITQKEESHNLIAAYTNSFQLNGPSNRPFRHHTARFANSLWNYTPTSLTTTGPINESVDLKIYVQDTRSTGSYSITYTIKHTDSTWVIGNWSSCSKLCGNGTMTRNVTCKTTQGCDLRSKPISTKTCSMEPCSNYRWIASEWSQCSTSCGGGVKTRSVKCKHVNETEVNDNYCTSTKPVHQEACSTEPCPRGCTDVYSQQVCKTIVFHKLCDLPVAQDNCCKTCGEKK